MGKHVQWAALKGEAVRGWLLQGFSPLLCCSGGGGPIQWEGLWVREPRSGKRPELGPKNPRLPRAPASSNSPFPSATLSVPSDGAWKIPGEAFQSNTPPSRCSADLPEREDSPHLSFQFLLAHLLANPASDPRRSRTPKMQGLGKIQCHVAWHRQVTPVLKVRSGLESWVLALLSDWGKSLYFSEPQFFPLYDTDMDSHHTAVSERTQPTAGRRVVSPVPGTQEHSIPIPLQLVDPED